MCQSHGTRCYNDSNKKLVKLTAKLVSAQSELTLAQKQLIAASRKSDFDFNQYAKLRKSITAFTAKKVKLQEDVCHVQRDVDGTLTGRKQLEQLRLSATTKKEIDELDVRRRTASSNRLARERSRVIFENGYTPAIRFAA